MAQVGAGVHVRDHLGLPARAAPALPGDGECGGLGGAAGGLDGQEVPVARLVPDRPFDDDPVLLGAGRRARPWRGVGGQARAELGQGGELGGSEHRVDLDAAVRLWAYAFGEVGAGLHQPFHRGPVGHGDGDQ